MEKLTPAEYRYMKVIWEHPEGITSHELYKPYTLTMGGQSTILRGIVRKGFATSVQKGKQGGKHKLSTFRVGTRLEYDRQAVSEKLERKMGMPSINMLMAAFCGRDELNDDEKKKLDTLIQELERQNSDG